jgi:hypothetical protein
MSVTVYHFMWHHMAEDLQVQVSAECMWWVEKVSGQANTEIW